MVESGMRMDYIDHLEELRDNLLFCRCQEVELIGAGKTTKRDAIEILEEKNVNVSGLIYFLGDDTIYIPVTSRDNFRL